MKKIAPSIKSTKGFTLFYIVLVFAVFMFISGQKSSPTPESKEEVQKQKGEMRQLQLSETNPDVQSKQKEQLTSQTEVKDKIGEELKKKSSTLTEEEEKFNKFRGVFGQEGMTEKEALQNLKILIKGSPETIHYYQDPVYGDEKGRFEKYSEDFCTVIYRVGNLKSKEGYSLLLEIIKEKGIYPPIRPSIRACAAEVIGWYGELKGGKWSGDKRSIPLLKEILNDKDPEVQLQAAGTLLSLGETDIALPVLDKLAETGIHQSTFALEKLFAPEERTEDGEKKVVRSHTKLWDKRGKEILIKALNYPSDEVKAFAAARLADMGVELNLVESVVTSILEKFKHKTVENYGLSKTKVPSRTGDLNAPADKYYSDGRACSHAIYASQVLGSKNVTVILEEISEINVGWGYVCNGSEAKRALATLGGKK